MPEVIIILCKQPFSSQPDESDCLWWV